MYIAQFSWRKVDAKYWPSACISTISCEGAKRLLVRVFPVGIGINGCKYTSFTGLIDFKYTFSQSNELPLVFLKGEVAGYDNIWSEISMADGIN